MSHRDNFLDWCKIPGHMCVNNKWQPQTHTDFIKWALKKGLVVMERMNGIGRVSKAKKYHGKRQSILILTHRGKETLKAAGVRIPNEQT